MVREALDDGQQQRVFQERKPPGPEVIKQRAEGFWTNRYPVI
jgi:hypothetical protein